MRWAKTDKNQSQVNSQEPSKSLNPNIWSKKEKPLGLGNQVSNTLWVSPCRSEGPSTCWSSGNVKVLYLWHWIMSCSSDSVIIAMQSNLWEWFLIPWQQEVWAPHSSDNWTCMVTAFSLVPSKGLWAELLGFHWPADFHWQQTVRSGAGGCRHWPRVSNGKHIPKSLKLMA